MTSGYLIAGYLLTWGALVLYVWRLSVREQRTRRALESERTIDGRGTEPELGKIGGIDG